MPIFFYLNNYKVSIKNSNYTIPIFYYCFENNLYNISNYYQYITNYEVKKLNQTKIKYDKFQPFKNFKLPKNIYIPTIESSVLYNLHLNNGFPVVDKIIDYMVGYLFYKSKMSYEEKTKLSALLNVIKTEKVIKPNVVSVNQNSSYTYFLNTNWFNSFLNLINRIAKANNITISDDFTNTTWNSTNFKYIANAIISKDTKSFWNKQNIIPFYANTLIEENEKKQFNYLNIKNTSENYYNYTYNYNFFFINNYQSEIQQKIYKYHLFSKGNILFFFYSCFFNSNYVDWFTFIHIC